MKINHNGHKGILTPGMTVQASIRGTFSPKPDFEDVTVVDLLSSQFTIKDEKGHKHFRFYQDVGQSWSF